MAFNGWGPHKLWSGGNHQSAAGVDIGEGFIGFIQATAMDKPDLLIYH